MTEREFYTTLGRIGARAKLSEDEAQMFEYHVAQMTKLLDISDSDDYFGTEGWTHRIFED